MTQTAARPTYARFTGIPVTVAVIAVAVVLNFGVGLAGYVLSYLARNLHLPVMPVEAVAYLVVVLPYAAVAIGAALGARTPLGRRLGLALPLLGWAVYVVVWFALTAGAHFYHATALALLSAIADVLVVAGWGCARRTGRLWLLGLPVTYLLVVLVTPRLSIAFFSVTGFGTGASQVWGIVGGLLSIVLVVAGGVVCWLLELAAKPRP